MAGFMAGLVTWTVLAGVLRVIYLFIFAGVGKLEWIGGDPPLAIDIVGAILLIPLLIASVYVGRIARREFLRIHLSTTPRKPLTRRHRLVVLFIPFAVYGSLGLGAIVWWLTGSLALAVATVLGSIGVGLALLIVASIIHLRRGT